MLISGNRLYELIEQGVITADKDNVNAASIDITLGSKILIEAIPGSIACVSLADKESPLMSEFDLTNFDYVIPPKEFVLASSNEIFNLPNNIACEYKLKSSLARSGLQHALAGWCDPGWNGSVLTLELSNSLFNHHLVLKQGMKIGQMVFFECDPVPDELNYANKGQYNGDETVKANKGLR